MRVWTPALSSPSSDDDDEEKKSPLTASAGVLDAASTSFDVDTCRADVVVPRVDVLVVVVAAVDADADADADDALRDEGAAKPLAELTSSKRQKPKQ